MIDKQENLDDIFGLYSAILDECKKIIGEEESESTELDLRKILKEGDNVYSPAYGYGRVVNTMGNFIGVSFSDSDNCRVLFSPKGKLFSFKDTECILFPSKEQRDWSKFKRVESRKDLARGTKCICSFNKGSWQLGIYDGDGLVKDSENAQTKYRYSFVIPVEKFNFKEFTFDEKDNYGTSHKQ